MGFRLTDSSVTSYVVILFELYTLYKKKTLLLYSTFFNHLNIYIKMWHHPSSINFLHLSKRKPLNSFIDIRQLLVLTFELNRLVTR